MDELVETLCFRLHVESGERWRLKQARFDARPIANHTWAMRALGYSKTEIAKQITSTANEFVKNNAQAVVWKACDAYDGYERAWRNGAISTTKTNTRIHNRRQLIHGVRFRSS